MRFMMLAFALAAGGCASSGSGVARPLPAPNPNGCYFYVYGAADYGGDVVVVNGPANYPIVPPTPSMKWPQAIRSIRVGESATVTLFSQREFKGAREELQPRTSQRRLEAAWAENVGSVSLSCH